MHSAFLLKRMLPIAALSTASVLAAELPAPQPLPENNGPVTVYRQVTSDGRVVYSDKTLPGAKVDHTMTIEPPIKGNLWSAEPGAKPVIPQHPVPTPVTKVPSIPAPGKKKSVDQANSDVIKAEMLLEDAKQRQAAGGKRLPGEPEAAYEARRKLLEREVGDAEAMVRNAIAERNSARSAR